MPFKFNPLTGTLDLVNSSGGGGGGGVTDINGEAGSVSVVAGPGVSVETSSGTVTVSARSYMPSGW